MQWQTLMKSVGTVLGAGMLFLACGPEAGTPTDEASTPDSRVQAMAPPDSCDERVDIGWCRVYSSRVPCNNGIEMYATWTPDGWCIPSDVCKYSQGPELVCPQ